jgi:hypothetical protein
MTVINFISVIVFCILRGNMDDDEERRASFTYF